MLTCDCYRARALLTRGRQAGPHVLAGTPLLICTQRCQYKKQAPAHISVQGQAAHASTYTLTVPRVLVDLCVSSAAYMRARPKSVECSIKGERDGGWRARTHSTRERHPLLAIQQQPGFSLCSHWCLCVVQGKQTETQRGRHSQLRRCSPEPLPHLPPWRHGRRGL